MYYYPEEDRTFEYHHQIRRAFPWVFFPHVITDEMLNYLGIYEMFYVMPEVEPHQIAEPSNVLKIDGQWVQQWTIRDRTPEEMPDPPVEPEDPPVDPETQEPVQSGS